MATVTKPIALDESLNTTEVTPRNIADVLADELSNIASKIQGSGSSVSWNQLQVTGDKIAEITISGVKTDVMSHSIAVSRIQTTGTHIADITIDGVKTELYAPQGSPSFNALIIVTAETGKTVTATKGGDTYTATEVSTGTYEVSVDSAGTWTISDGTLSDTVSVVSQTTYYVTLSSVPDGKTVTPTDDVSIWLQCGQRSENYTTLAEVLADSTCLSALMSDNNAVDYLVRSKSFAKSEALVPIMTSDNTPSGICIASTVLSGYNAYKAFDGDNTSAWIPNNNATNNYVGYEFTSAQRVERVTATIMRGNWGGSVPSRTFKVQGYSDDWHDIGTITTEATNTTSTDNYTATITTSGLYTKCRLFCEDITHSDGQYDVRIMELQFYNVAVGVAENATAMSYIGLNNYCANTLLADSDWCSAIFESTYKESVLNVKAPTMTSNNTPSGVCGLYNTTMYGNNPPYYAFDGNLSTMARGNTGSDYGIIYYQFPSAKKCVGFELISSNDLSLSEYYFVASNDGTNWDSLETYIDDNTQSLVGHSKVNNTSYDYYGIKITKVKAGGTEYPYRNAGFDMKQLQFYGRADV